MKDFSKEIKLFITSVENIRSKSGAQFMINYMKTVRNHITRYIAGKPAYKNDKFVSLTDGFPTKFLFLKDLIDEGNVQIVLTLLTYTRSIKFTEKEISKIKINLNSINDKYKGKNYTIPKIYIKEFVDNFNLRCDPIVYDDKIHYVSTKSSPNGEATLSSL